MTDEAGKAALRKALLAARRGRTKRDGEACRTLLAIPEIVDARVVAAYSALPGEPDIGAALAALGKRGIRVLLPVLLADRDLEFRTADGELVPLEEVDVVLAPAVAVDRAGHRLGRGGGSYDRALSRIRDGALVIAIVHAEEVLESVPVEAHDLPVGAVLAGDVLIRVGS